MLVSSKKLILDAQKGEYAIGCFNTADLETTLAIIRAAEAQMAPVLIATSEKTIQYAGLETLSAMIIAAVKKAKVPIALHLDHGKTIHMLTKCIANGYTSLMFDGSSLPIEENELKTRHAVELAHHANLPCEGELGSLGKSGESESNFTNPNLVKGYLRRTGVDFLAISIGTKHGSLGCGSEKINLDLLNEIGQKTDTPLVLHGASGVSDADIQAAVKGGICKINIDTDIRQTFTRSMKEIAQDESAEEDPRELLGQVMGDIQELVEEKIQIFGSSQRCEIKK